MKSAASPEPTQPRSLAVAAADGTGAQRAVVAEKVFRGGFEPDAVGFEQVGEAAGPRCFVPDAQVAFAFREGGLDRVKGPADGVGVGVDREAVDQQPPFVRKGADVLKRLFHLGEAAVAGGQAGESFLLEVQDLFDFSLFLPADVGQDVGGAAGLEGGEVAGLRGPLPPWLPQPPGRGGILCTNPVR